MQKNIRLEKPANATDLPAGWYKESGLPIWYTNIFGNKFQITNAHETAPGMWYIKCPGIDWTRMEGIKNDLQLKKNAKIILHHAHKHMRTYFSMCISRVENDLENISKI